MKKNPTTTDLKIYAKNSSVNGEGKVRMPTAATRPVVLLVVVSVQVQAGIMFI